MIKGSGAGPSGRDLQLLATPSASPITSSSMSNGAGVVQQDLGAGKTKLKAQHDYKGFVAGVFSGIAKLTGESSWSRGAREQPS